MPSISFKYVDSGSNTYTRTFSTALSVKGFKPGDGHVQFPKQRNEYLNGSVRKKQAGFRRVFEIDLGVLTAAADLAFLGGWLGSETQYLTYSYDSTTETDLRVVDFAEEYEAEWINNIEIGRRVVIQGEEANLITAYPSGTPTPVNSDLVSYFKKKVAITGTPDSPQTFTLGDAAGSGTLVLTDEDGDAFPTVDAGVYIWRVVIDPLYQQAGVFFSTIPSLNGNNYPTFAAAVNDMGSASSDGAYYMDIGLELKLK